MKNHRFWPQLLLVLLLCVAGFSATALSSDALVQEISAAMERGDIDTVRRLMQQLQEAEQLAQQEPPAPLWEVAIDQGDLPMLQQLVKDGYTLNPADWFDHPLRRIDPYSLDITAQHLDMMAWILQQTGQRDDYGLLLNEYVETDHIAGAAVLLENGVDPNVWIRGWSSAWDLAESDAMREVLEQHGASSNFRRVLLTVVAVLALLGWLTWYFLFRSRKPVPEAANVAAQPERNMTKGKWYIMAGTALLLFAAISVLLARYGRVLGIPRPDMAGGMAIVITAAVISFIAVRMITIGKGLRTQDGDEVIERAERPLFLYLRSFALDEEDGKHSMPVYMGARVPINPWESGLAAACSAVGNLVAIGRPGEQFSTVGAARVYVTDDQWQDKVIELIGKTELVFWTYGESEGLLWEIQRLVATVPPEQLVIALPFWQLKPSERDGAWQQVRERMQSIFPAGLPDSIGDSLFISFDADWNARAVQPQPTPWIVRAAMLFGRNRIMEGARGLLQTRGYTLPRPGFWTYLFCSIAILGWTTVFSVLMVMIYGLFVAFTR